MQYCCSPQRSRLNVPQRHSARRGAAAGSCSGGLLRVTGVTRHKSVGPRRPRSICDGSSRRFLHITLHPSWRRFCLCGDALCFRGRVPLPLLFAVSKVILADGMREQNIAAGAPGGAARPRCSKTGLLATANDRKQLQRPPFPSHRVVEHTRRTPWVRFAGTGWPLKANGEG